LGLLQGREIGDDPPAFGAGPSVFTDFQDFVKPEMAGFPADFRQCDEQLPPIPAPFAPARSAGPEKSASGF